VRGGFTTWRVRSHRESQDFSSSNNSPISLRFSGPTVGLEVMF
jgi:hypothetical protein